MPDIKHSITIDAQPERIHPLITSAAGFRQWWAAQVTQDNSTGSVELTFFNRATVYVLKLVRKAPLEVEWLCQTGKEWEGTRLHFQMALAANSTLVRFTHAGWKSETDYFVACTTTWGELMFRLKAAAEGRGSGPLFTADGISY